MTPEHHARKGWTQPLAIAPGLTGLFFADVSGMAVMPNMGTAR